MAQSAGNVGPNLDDVLPGQSPDQIRQDIVDPGAKIAAGFDNIMPATYGDSIPSEDLDKLINFLSTCAGIGSSGDEGDANIQFNDDGSCVAPGGSK